MDRDELITILKDELYILDHQVPDSGLDELLERAEANPTNIPMTASEKWEAHPPIHVQRVIHEMEGSRPASYNMDVLFVMLQILALPAVALGILMWVAIADI